MLIQTATDQDWPRIFPLYSAIAEDGRTIPYPTGQTLQEARGWWMEPSPGQTVIALSGDGDVMGTAKMGPNRPARGAHIGTATFMVDPSYRGRGVGRALGEYVIDWHRQAGYHGIQFNAVVETNHPAVHLWQSLGFEILTTVPESFDHPDHGLVGLHLMYQKL